jgi:putative membrane protein
MKITTMLVIAVLGTVSAGACAQQTTTSIRTNSAQQDRGDRKSADKISAAEFAKKAGAAGAAEVEMGKLGAQKATDAEVKEFAQKMVTDHTKANKELMAAAKSKGLEVPTEPGLTHKGMMEKFERQTADKDFNHDFMQQMVRDHKQAVELFTTAANDATLDPDMRALAKKTLPTLKQHLAEAQTLEGKFAK